MICPRSIAGWEKGQIIMQHNSFNHSRSAKELSALIRGFVRYHGEVCREGVRRWALGSSQRWKTSSIRRFGPTYSAFILFGLIASTGMAIWRQLFWCQRLLMQSSTRAIKPEATIALRSVNKRTGKLPYEECLLGNICGSVKDSFVTDPH